MQKRTNPLMIAAFAQLFMAGFAQAQFELEEIVVTATKRSENINDVGMAITAATGDVLKERRITDPTDLVRIVPGLTSNNDARHPTFTLRGIGVIQTDLAASPSVSIYVDETPIPFPSMTRGATLDIERVEVLKGPQGTLFGQNSTAGAINYIAAKPTEEFEAGINVSFDEYSKADIDGYISGSLSDTVKARLALRSVTGGAWQESLTRPDDELGDRDYFQARFLLEWQPTDKLSTLWTFQTWSDDSDLTASQLVKLDITNPSALDFPQYNDPAILDSEIAPRNAEKADWTSSVAMRAEDDFYQTSVRVDYDLTADLTLTSITSYMKLDTWSHSDTTGMSYQQFETYNPGEIETLNQELRLTGNWGDNLSYILGANFDDASVSTRTDYFSQFTVASIIPALIEPYRYPGANLDVDTETWAVFGNIDYAIDDHWTFHAGIRHTDYLADGENCTYEWDDSERLNDVFNFLQAVSYTIPGGKDASSPFVPLTEPGQCISFTPAPEVISNLDPYPVELDERNTSWRFGLDYHADSGVLYYATYSRGFKAGLISTQVASSVQSFDPATQEKVDSVEFGVKAPLWDKRAQLDISAFYSEYEDKQLQGFIPDAVFGSLGLLVNVPESVVHGIEASFMVAPIEGLRIASSVAYHEAEVTDEFLTFDTATNTFFDFNRSDIPWTPRWSGNLDIQYEWSLNESILAFVGSSTTFTGEQVADFSSPESRSADPNFSLNELPSRAIHDLRAGLKSTDDQWSVTLWARNASDKFYLVNSGSGDLRDGITRRVGQPREIGITATLRTF